MVRWLGTPARVGITLSVCPPGTGLWFDPVQNKCVQKCVPGQEWDPVQGKCFSPIGIVFETKPQVEPLPASAKPRVKSEEGSVVPILIVTAIGAAIFWAVVA